MVAEKSNLTKYGKKGETKLIKTQNVDAQLLNEYINKSGLKINYILEQLVISYQAFDMKRKSRNSFRASEVYVLCDLLNITDDDKKRIFLF